MSGNTEVAEGTDNEVVEKTTSTTAVVDATNGSDLMAQLEEYKKRYNNLNSALSKRQTEIEEKSKLLDAVTTERGELSTQLETLKTAFAEKETLIADLEVQAQNARRQADRVRLIATEFPDFLDLEKDGLLPPDEDLDVLVVKLNKMRERLGKAVSEAKNTGAAGVLPPEQDKDSSESLEALKLQLHQASFAGDRGLVETITSKLNRLKGATST